MEGEAVLRQLVGQIQELWELYGSFSLDHAHLNPSSMEDDYCGLIMEEKSEYLKMMEANKYPLFKRTRREKSREKSLASCSTDMEQQIWKEFPEDLFEAVIARLPIATFFRFRSVCQKWNSLLTSNSFSQHFAEVPHMHPWFYTITHEGVNGGAMYDPAMKKWHHPSISFLPAKMIILPVASAGGLVCSLDIGHRNFYICNPLTQSFRELPPRSVRVWSRVAVGMILNGNTASSGYKIIWLGCNGDHEIYDSVQNSWTRLGIVPPNIKLPLSLNFRSQTVSIGSTLYFMRAEPDGILSYDVATGVWKQFIIPSPLHLTDHTLAEHKGQVMLVGLLSKNAATCICIWELQKMTLLWKEVDRMPNIWCLDFYEGPRLHASSWQEKAVDCKWHCVSSMSHCFGLTAFSVSGNRFYYSKTANMSNLSYAEGFDPCRLTIKFNTFLLRTMVDSELEHGSVSCPKQNKWTKGSLHV